MTHIWRTDPVAKTITLVAAYLFCVHTALLAEEFSVLIGGEIGGEDVVAEYAIDGAFDSIFTPVLPDAGDDVATLSVVNNGFFTFVYEDHIVNDISRRYTFNPRGDLLRVRSILFEGPFKFETDSTGQIFQSDFGNRITIWDRDGNFSGTFAGEGLADADQHGNIFVASNDGSIHSIRRYSPDGMLVDELIVPFPVGAVTIDEQSNVLYVNDTNGERLVPFDISGTSLLQLPNSVPVEGFLFDLDYHEPTDSFFYVNFGSGIRANKNGGIITRYFGMDDVLSISVVPLIPAGDFDFDGNLNCDDIDALVAAIVASDNDAAFDLTGEGVVNGGDLEEWLSLAGDRNLASGNSYLEGDADLSGSVDGNDFLIWNANKFTSNPSWCSGDFNHDGEINGTDFVIWNGNKFESSDLLAVPESVFPLGMLAFLAVARRISHQVALS
jgi:hypothetical protein